MRPTELRFWEEPTLTSLNRLPIGSLHRTPELILDGAWRFQLLDHPEDDVSGDWRHLDVPGCWGMQGTDDLPHYTNVAMPFESQPPRTPTLNPTGVYERDLQLLPEWAGRRVVLHVGAAESALQVEVNGGLAGLSKDSHLAAEFDVTDLLVPGVNVVRLTVVKWSDASFIEDQDQWWLGGITRSVYLYSTGARYLEDVEIQPALNEDLRTGDLSVAVQVGGALGAEGLSLRLTSELRTISQEPNPPRAMPEIDLAAMLRAHDEFHSRPPGDLESYEEPTRSILRALVSADGPSRVLTQALGPLDGLRLWSHEDPHLYGLRVELCDESGETLDAADMRVGFRRVAVQGVDLLINGLPVLIRGVNRHDSHPITGRVVSPEDMRNDLLLMRRLGFNAVRTAHYPNAPEFLDLCDELGLYVIDEANIESHAYRHSLCDDPAYLNAWLDRVSRMVRRDRNHPSVIAWSLGNESGAGANHRAAAAWVRRTDPTRPLHYEGAITYGWNSNAELTDLICPMYPGVEAIVEHAKHGERKAPIIMCEYSHAMGNSNGGLSDYWAAIESTPGLQGGFIWEWSDHALQRRDKDGERLVYGGGFGDEPNDGAFCLDGLTFANRIPKPAALEHQFLALPIAIEHTGDSLAITNKQSFTTLEALGARYELLDDGHVVDAGLMELPGLDPGQSCSVPFPFRPTTSEAEQHLTVELWHAVDQPWAAAGQSLGFTQVLLRPAEPVLAEAATELATVALDAAGALHDDRLSSAPHLCLWRAPIDNETVNNRALLWQSHGLQNLERSLDGIEQIDGGQQVRLTYATATGIEFTAAECWQQTSSGVRGSFELTVPPSVSDLPRIGMSFRVRDIARVDWHGLGPHECYPDRRAGARVGRWSTAVDDLHTPYLRPQESGGRNGVRSFELSGPGSSLRVRLGEPSQVSWNRFHVDQLTAVQHHDDLVARDDVEVIVDAAHRGLGTASCGPDTTIEHRIGPGVYRWSMTILD